jgi:small subunit ribosomal protein S1
MADLLAKQETKIHSVTRGQEIEGVVLSLTDQEAIIDLGTKSEGVISKKDLPKDAKVGDTIKTFVLQTENESGQVVLGVQKVTGKNQFSSQRFDKFQEAKKNNTTLSGKVLELNKGGLIVEVNGTRGFLPTSQVSLSQAANLEEMIGKDIEVTVIEADSSQNRLIFSQKSEVTEEHLENLNKLKVGDKVSGVVAAVLQFGVFVTLESGVEGLVHISEISWEKTEDPSTKFKIGDAVNAEVISVDHTSGRVNLSIKKLEKDPFTDKVKDLQASDVVKGKVVKTTANGVQVMLESGVEGIIPTAKLEADTNYEEGAELTVIIDSVDTHKRKITLSPFITSTSTLIYK